jgi:hypothetical protein
MLAEKRAARREVDHGRAGKTPCLALQGSGGGVDFADGFDPPEKQSIGADDRQEEGACP